MISSDESIHFSSHKEQQSNWAVWPLPRGQEPEATQQNLHEQLEQCQSPGGSTCKEKI